MLKLIRHCACCGVELESLRSTKAYCSDACRKKAGRGGTTLEQRIESRWIVECLRRMGLISKLWARLLLGQVAAGLRLDGPDPHRVRGIERLTAVR